jgi:hypothetical protein
LLPDVVPHGGEFAHVVSIDDVYVAVFSGSDGQLTHGAVGVGHVGQQHDAARAEIDVAAGLGDLARHREVVGHRKRPVRRGDLHE